MAADRPASKKQKQPLTAEDAVRQVAAAGAVATRAHRAGLEFMGVMARAREARFRREAVRVRGVHGEDSPEADDLAERTARHAGLVRAVAAARDRAAVPVPARDSNAAVLYGRTLDAKAPIAGAVVEALSPAGEVIASAKSDEHGHYELRLATDLEPAEVQLQVTRPGDRAPVPAGVAGLPRGARGYRDVVLPVSGKAATGKDTEPEGRDVTVPSVVGLRVDEAAVALTDAGLRVGDVEGTLDDGRVRSQKPAAKTKVKRGTRVTLYVGPKS
jgi:PASTA domain